MAKTILLTLASPAAMLINKIGQIIPAYEDSYDAVPYLETVLEEVFLGKPVNQDLSGTDILAMDVDQETAKSINHVVSMAVVDAVTGFMPWLKDANHGYHFKVHDNFDVEITVPDYSMNHCQPAPDPTFDLIEEIREAVAGGGYVSERMRRFAGC